MMPATPQRLPLFGLLALAPLFAHAQMAPAPLAEPPPLSTELPAGLGAMPMAPPPGALRGVKKLGDGELDCAQLYAETKALERSGELQQAEATQAQQAMAQSQNDMMKQANDLRGGGMGSAIGSSVLGMIPGAGYVQGMAMQAAASARMANMQDNVNKMMQAQNQLMSTEQALEFTRARSEHLTDLFLKKGCKLSEVTTAAEPAR